MRKDAPHPKRLLVVMPTWVGDAVMATPFLRAVRRTYADARITLLIRPNTRAVLEDTPWMDDLIEWQPARKGLRKLLDPFRIASRLRAEQFDRAVLLSNSFRSALVLRLAGIPDRVGYDRDGRGFLLTDRLQPPREGRSFAIVGTVRYYNRLAEHIGCPPPGEALELFTTPADEEAVQERLAGWGIADHHPLVLINPGAAFGPSKLWPPERYGQVADRLTEDVDARVVVTCGPGEEELAWRVHAAMRHKPFVVDKPRGTLSQLKALVRRCDLLLNNDTGPRHFAKAFKRPVVTVFGSTHQGWTDTDYDLERKVQIEVDCGPCQQKVCPLGHHKCMVDLPTEMVYNAARALLEATRSRRDSSAASFHAS